MRPVSEHDLVVSSVFACISILTWYYDVLALFVSHYMHLLSGLRTARVRPSSGILVEWRSFIAFKLYGRGRISLEGFRRLVNDDQDESSDEL